MCVVLSQLGCGGGTTTPEVVDSSSTAQVAGKVTLNGKPFKGTGYSLVGISDSGSSQIIGLGADGSFTGMLPVGTLKAGVLPNSQAEEAHGDAGKLTSSISLTVAGGENKDLKVDLTTAPPPLPKQGGAGGGHSGGGGHGG